MGEVLTLSSSTPRFKAGVPACAEAALSQIPCAGGGWASEESAARMQRGCERRETLSHRRQAAQPPAFFAVTAPGGLATDAERGPCTHGESGRVGSRQRQRFISYHLFQIAF